MVKTEYTNRIQILVDDSLMAKIDRERGDVPASVFLRKKLEAIFK